MRGKASYLKEGLQLDDADVRTGDDCACLGIMGLCDSYPHCLTGTAHERCTILVYSRALYLQDDLPTAIPLLSTILMTIFPGLKFDRT